MKRYFVRISLVGVLFSGLFDDTLPIKLVTGNKIRSCRLFLDGEEAVVAYFEIFSWNLLKRLKRTTESCLVNLQS